MPDGISIGIGSDTRDFASGVQKGVVKPLEDAQKVLGEVAKAGDDASSRLEDGFRDQQRATEQYRRDYDQMSEDIRSASQRTNRQISSDARQSSHDVSEGTQEAHESLKQNAIETAASFNGSFDQISGGLQGLLSEFLAGFGPAGVIAGLGAAAALGAVTAQIDAGQEAAVAQKAAIAALGGEYIDAGKVGRREFSAIADSLKQMATSDGSDVIITLQKAFDDAKTAGADYEQIVTSIASTSPKQIGKAKAALDELAAAQVTAVKGAADYANDPNADLSPKLRAISRLSDALHQAETQSRAAAEQQRLAAEAGLNDFQLKADLLKQLETKYDDAAAGADHFNKKTGDFEVGDYLRDLKKVRHALEEYKDDLAKSDLTPAAKKFLESQGADQAEAMLRGYRHASPRQKAELNEVWSTSGKENAASYADALGQNLAKIKAPAPTIETPVVPAPDTAALDRFLETPYVKRLTLEGVTRAGTRVF